MVHEYVLFPCHSKFMLLAPLSPLYLTDIGYLMGIAHRKLKDKNQYSKNRQNRNVDDTGDIEVQRKCIKPFTV